MTRALALCGLLGFVCIATPAMAGCDDNTDSCWSRSHHALYHMENRIAFLEANPDADESYKGPVIDNLHAQVLRLRAAMGPRWPHWPSPCCYSRRPIYIR